MIPDETIPNYQEEIRKRLMAVDLDPASLERKRKFLLAPQPECIEVACRAWWDATGENGKRIATCSWDEFVARAKTENAPPQYQASVDDYRRRMAFALMAAVGLP